MLKLHQVLHGYADGHRQLATSLMLKQRDLRTMLVLSDISGTGARVSNDGYLTGYPLTESGVYALARTWAAPEMSRPGCVWTHTLLIDFVDLATLESLENILTFFKRPQIELMNEYGKPLQVSDQLTLFPLSNNLQKWGRNLLESLYANPSCSVIMDRPTEIDVDRVLLALWSQQWPRLRRSFRFCTLSASDRSFEGNRFDIQLLASSDRSIRSRFPSTFDAENIKSLDEPWLNDALNDLMRPDSSGLRSFIRHIGADVATGREGFRALCRLHRLVGEFESNSKSVEDAIKLLQNELGSVQVRAARSIVAEAILEQTGQPDDVATEFLKNNLQFIDLDTYKKKCCRLSYILWISDPTKLIPLIEEGGPLNKEQECIFNAFTITELINGLQKAIYFEEIVLNYRPDVLNSPIFWLLEGINLEIVFESINRLVHSRSLILAAIIAAHRNDISFRCVQEFGPSEVLQALNVELEANGQPVGLEKWISASIYDRYIIAQFLASDYSKSRLLLVAIANALPPSFVPNDFGTDPWLTAYLISNGELNNDDTNYLYAYFLSRALSFPSRNLSDLVTLSFDFLHETAASSRLPDKAWILLDPYLPKSSSFWFDWDVCQRLRAGVVNLFIENNLLPQEFAKITKDDKLFYELTLMATGNRKGRKYLRRVISAIQVIDDMKLKLRMHAIEKLLD